MKVQLRSQLLFSTVGAHTEYHYLPEAAPVKVMFTSFEDFREAPADYFDRVLDFYGIDRSLFAAEADAEVVHLRKGEKDEWREVFSTGQRKRAWGMLSGPLADAFGWKP